MFTTAYHVMKRESSASNPLFKAIATSGSKCAALPALRGQADLVATNRPRRTIQTMQIVIAVAQQVVVLRLGVQLLSALSAICTSKHVQAEMWSMAFLL